jgi:hypothetical protein
MSTGIGSTGITLYRLLESLSAASETVGSHDENQ